MGGALATGKLYLRALWVGDKQGAMSELYLGPLRVGYI